MADTVIFKVVRRHIGDREYGVGEIRSGTLADLGHLVPHILQPLGAKAASPLKNKAAGAAPANKAGAGRKAD